MGSDGLYDKMTNSEVVEDVWITAINEAHFPPLHLHKMALNVATGVSKTSLTQWNMDNVSSIVIMFKNMVDALKGSEKGCYSSFPSQGLTEDMVDRTHNPVKT